MKNISKNKIMGFLTSISLVLLFFLNSSTVRADVKGEPPTNTRVKIISKKGVVQTAAWYIDQDANGWDYVLAKPSMIPPFFDKSDTKDSIWLSYFYIEPAGSNKFYIRSEKYNSNGYNYLNVSDRGYFYLDQKSRAVKFDFSQIEGTTYSIYESNSGSKLGIYSSYLTIGSGTEILNWDVIPA